MPTGLAASGQRRPHAAGQSVATNDATLALPSSGNAASVSPALARIAEAWDELPPHVREAITLLVDSWLLSSQRNDVPSRRIHHADVDGADQDKGARE